MKRLIGLSNILEKCIISLAIICFVQWIIAWIMLPVNAKISLILFVSQFIAFILCLLVIFIWSRVLKKIDKHQ